MTVYIPESNKTKIAIIGTVTILTLGIHYGWVLDVIFGPSHWIHAIHGRFCYIPIVIAASWFGIRGGIYEATIVSAIVLPLIFRLDTTGHEFAGEVVEILFYYAIAILTGWLVEREFKARKRQEEALLQLERSRQLSRVGQIAAGVAHEIKNPLASIKGAIEIINDERTSPEERDEFNDILIKEVKRMDGTITEFLAFARPKETKLTKINLSETINSCVRQMNVHAQREGVTIFADLLNEVYIDGDKEKIHEMTLNILLNSLQVSESGSTIRVTLDEAPRKMARLRFEDSGTGIDVEHVDKVFEPFFTTKASGTGLGLAIVKAIVDRHGGSISLRNRPHGGTTVEVLLPTYQKGGKQ